MRNFNDEDLADIYSLQAAEWMKTCPKNDRCPASKVFRYLIAQRAKIERLEFEIKRVQEWPDER